MRDYLNELGINISTTTPYHPKENSQCERFNGTIWRTVRLWQYSHKLNISYWEDALNSALHSIRSLLNTATNVLHTKGFLLFKEAPEQSEIKFYQLVHYAGDCIAEKS